MPALDVELKNDLCEITRLLNLVEQFAKDTGLPDDALNAVMLSLDEAVTNTINYGFPGGGIHCIRLTLRREPDSITSIIEDDGIPFNPLEAPEADLTSPIEDRPIGGLGIHFIRNYMDELYYRREDGKNIFTLVKKIS